MKTFKYIFTVLLVSFLTISCSKDDDNEPIDNSLEGLNKIYEFTESDHVLELYSRKTRLEVGYNEIFIRILDLGSNNYIANTNLSWMPMMHMHGMEHSCPHSSLKLTDISGLYSGHLVFQMASNDMEHWELTLNYVFNSQPRSITKEIEVSTPADGLTKLQVFTGSDDVKYILAYASPIKPEVAINDAQAVLYKMEDMHSFSVVENYKIAVDPRMPSMGNHSSPNNQDYTYNAAKKLYAGKLSFTMTGLWKINMQLLNAQGEVIKGEPVDGDHSSSSLYFEVEF